MATPLSVCLMTVQWINQEESGVFPFLPIVHLFYAPISIDTVNFEKSLCLSLSFNDDYFAKIFCNMLSNFEIYFNATSSYDYQEITFDASASCSLVIDIRQRFALL